MPEIKHLCPCCLDVKVCKRDDNGAIFKIAKVTTFTGKKLAIYPRGNTFAKKACKVIFA